MRIKPLIFIIVLTLAALACNTVVLEPPTPTLPAPTDTPSPTATITETPTNTPRPSPTLRPTRTPNLAATQRYEGYSAEALGLFDRGYLSTTDGRFIEYDDFLEEWAQMGWYRWWDLGDEADDFYMSARFAWSSAYHNAANSGCGFAFAIQENDDHYAVFLDRVRVLFLISDKNGTRELRLTRGNGRVRFDNPAEADFTLIIKGRFAYVIVDDVLTGQYTLAQSIPVRGRLALTLLSGTNRDYGTRCEMTNIHAWFPDK
jgi:hypothetical protein